MPRRSVKNEAFFSAGRRSGGRASGPRKSTFFPAFWGGLAGAVLSLAGVWLQSYLSDASELKRAERGAVVAVLADVEAQSDSQVLLKSAWNHIRYATFSNATILKAHADNLRRDGHCENSVTEECKDVLVRLVATYRQQLDLEPVSQDDLRILLDQPLRQMEAALKAGRPFGALPGSPAPQN